MRMRSIVTLVMLGLSGFGLSARIVAQEKDATRVTLEMKDVSAEEALAQLFKAAGEKYGLDESAKSALKQARVSATFRDIPAGEAIGLLASALGLSAEKKAAVWQLKANPATSQHTFVRRLPHTTEGSGTASITVTRGDKDNNVRTYAFSLGGARPPSTLQYYRLREPLSRFQNLPRLQTVPSIQVMPRLLALQGKSITCPHCKKSATIQQPSTVRLIARQCPKCNRPARADYKFCPYDGTELPDEPKADEARFCPFCGKELGKSGGEGKSESKSESSSSTRIRKATIIQL